MRIHTDAIRLDSGEGWDPVKGEMILLVAGTETQAKITGHFSFSIAIEGIEINGVKSAVAVLDAMAAKSRAS